MLKEFIHYQFTVKKLKSDDIITYENVYYIILFFERIGPKPNITVVPLGHGLYYSDFKYRKKIYLSDRKIKKVSLERQKTLRLLYC